MSVGCERAEKCGEISTSELYALRDCMCRRWGDFIYGWPPQCRMNGTEARSGSHWTVRHSHLWELGTPEFFGHRLRTSMTSATVEDSTAGRTLRTGRPPVGGLPSHGVSGLCVNSLARWQSGPGHEKAADADLCLLLWGSDNCL